MKVSKALPSTAEDRKSQLTKAVTEKLDNWQMALFIAGQRLNDLTGYSGIDNLKRDIEDQGKIGAPLYYVPKITHAEWHELSLRRLKAKLRIPTL